MKLTEHFKLEEFEKACKIPDELLPNVQELANNLEVLRQVVGKPIIITPNGGYRSPEHNEKIGGAKNSYHKKAMAADFIIHGMTSEEIADAIEQLIFHGKMKEGGLGIYPTKGFAHYDIRGKRARWRQE